MRTLLDHLPALAPFAERLHFDPSADTLTFDVVPDQQAEAGTLADWAFQHRRQCNLAKVLEETWHQQTGRIVADSTAPEHSAPKPPPCREHGICLCRGRGKLLWRVRNCFLKALRTAFPPKSVERTATLMPGCVFVELYWEEKAPAEADSAWLRRLQSLTDAASEPDTEPGSSSPLWCHLAVQYLKPFRPTFQRVTPRGETRPGLLEVEQIPLAGEAQKNKLPGSKIKLLEAYFFNSSEVLLDSSAKIIVGMDGHV